MRKQKVQKPDKYVHIVKIDSDDEHIDGIDSVWDDVALADRAVDLNNKYLHRILHAYTYSEKVLGKDDFDKWYEDHAELADAQYTEEHPEENK